MNENSAEEPIEYVLGVLSDEERGRFEERLGREPDLREKVAETESLVASLRSLPSDSWEPLEPPPFSLPINGHAPTVGADADATATEPPPPPRPTSRRRFASGWRIPAIAGGALALVGFGIVVGSILGGDDSRSTETPAIVSSTVLRPIEPAGRDARGDAQVVEAGDAEQSLSISVADMPATPPGRYYEVWLMSGQGKLISLGGFRVGDGGRRSIDVPLPVDPASYRLIDVSLERTDGNPGHSAVSLLRGPT